MMQFVGVHKKFWTKLLELPHIFKIVFLQKQPPNDTCKKMK
jgi:hypothetical protein